MKKKIFSLIIICLLSLGFTPNSYAQITNSIYPKAPFTSLNHIVVEGDNIFTFGTCETSIISTDGGLSWTNVNITESVKAIDLMPGSNGNSALYLSKDNLSILNSSDLSFTEISNGTLKLGVGNFNDLAIAENNIYVIGNSSIYRSDANNIDWQPFASLVLDADDYVTASDIVANYLYLGTNNGEIIQISLTDGNILYQPSLISRISKIAMVDDNKGYISAQSEQYFYKTTDGWLNKSKTEGMPENIGPIAYGDMVMSINTNRMYVSSDGGITSTYNPYLEDGTIDLVWNTFMTEDGTLYFAGRSSTIFKTEDFGQSYINLNVSPKGQFNQICILDSGLGYAIADAGSVVKTSDGGENWTPIDLGFETDKWLSALICYPDGRLLIGNDDELKIFENDVLIESLEIGTRDIIQGNDGDYLIAAQLQNNNSVLARSTDRGSTWEVLANVPGNYGFLEQNNQGTIYAPSGTENVYFGKNQGMDWDIAEFDRENIYNVTFLNDNVGVYNSSGKLYKTTDGGITSELIASNYAPANIHFFDEQHIVFTSPQSQKTQVLFSDNGGSNFQNIETFCTPSTSSFYKDNTLWLGQKGGHINKTTIVLEPDHVVQHNVGKAQLFPNPNVSSGKLNLLGPITEVTNVKCYDMLGKIVFSMNLLPGEDHFNLPQMTQGSYFIRLDNKNERLQYKLMISE